MSEMNAGLPVRPLRYDPSFESPAEDESKTQQELTETLVSIMETTSKDYGHAVRSVHAKSHGILKGEMRVDESLPEALRQGVFAEPGRFPVVMRLSTNPGDLLDDSISVPRGLALKIVGVKGDRLPGSDGATTQDFVMVDAPAFVAPDAKAFLKSLKMLAGTTDQPQGLKKVASAVLRGAEKVVEAVGSESPTLITMGGHANTQILGATFYTQVPLLYGPYVAKLSIAPVSPELTALSGKAIDVAGHPNALRDSVRNFFKAGSGEWEVRVQLLTNLETMPIEDATVPWSEEESPYIPVARISVGPQSAWDEDRAAKIEDGMAFSPWHGLAAHRPLGSIMRARKSTYEASARFRSNFNRCPIHEPASDAEIGVA